MSMSKKRPGMKYGRISVYSTEKNFASGKPLTTKGFYYTTEEDRVSKTNEIKRQQKLDNEMFKNKMKNEMAGGKMIYTNRVTQSLREISPNVHSSIILKLDKNTGNTTALFGSSKAGKTTLLMHLYRKYYDKKSIINTMFAGNIHQPEYQREPGLIKISDFGKEGEKYIQIEKFINQKTNNKYEWCNWFEDITDSSFSGIINKLVLTYRNSNISSIFAVQYDKMISRRNRGNLNNVIFMSFNTDDDVVNVIKTYLKSYFLKMGLRNINDMVVFYRKMTLNRGFIYVNPASQTISFHRLRL